MRKRIVGVVTAIAMIIVSFISETGSSVPNIINDIIASAESSGTCGDHITWQLSDEGTLYLDGYGEMFDYTSGDVVPWYRKKDDIKNIIITSGITSISNSSFRSEFSLEEVSIPDTVTKIGDNAFNSCHMLSKVSLPPNITKIGFGTFCGCDQLKEITIPDNVTVIDEGAFCSCLKLEKIVIPEKVISVGRNALGNCEKLESVTFKNRDCDIYLQSTSYNHAIYNIWYGGKPVYCGVIYGYEGSTAQNYAAACGYDFKVITEVEEDDEHENTINGEIINSGKCGDNLKWLFFKDGVLAIIGSGNMYNYDEGSTPWSNIANDVTNIVLSKYITSVGDAAFCDFSKITNIMIPENVKYIGKSAFKNCLGITGITIPPTSVVFIGEAAFYGCEKLSKITMPRDIKAIYDYTFMNCYKLDKIVLPNSIETIGCYAFANCEKLASINMPSKLKTINNSSFQNCIKLNYVKLPSSVESVDELAFSGCSNLESITFVNPLCHIKSSEETVPIHSIIIGYEESTAFDYAKQHLNAFMDINNKNIADDRQYKDFIVGRDTNSYFHTRSNDYDINAGFVGIKDYKFKKCSQEYYEELTRYSDKPEKDKILNILNEDDESKYEGKCYGIALSIGLVKQNLVSSSDLSNNYASTYYDLIPGDNNDCKMQDMINYYHLSQYLSKGGVSAIECKHYKNINLKQLFNTSDLHTILKCIVDKANKQKPFLLSFGYNANLYHNKAGGHSIIVLGCNQINNEYQIIAYDENEKNYIDYNYLTIKDDFSGFKANSAKFDDENYLYFEVADFDLMKGTQVLSNNVSKIDSNKMQYSGKNIAILSNSSVSTDNARINNTTITFSINSDFEIIGKSGKNLRVNKGVFNGNIEILDINAHPSDSNIYYDVKLATDEEYTIKSFNNGYEFEIRDNDHFYSIESKTSNEAVINMNKGITIKGSEYDFKAKVGAIKDDKPILLTISGNATDDVFIDTSGEQLTLKPVGEIDNVKGAAFDASSESKKIYGKVEDDLIISIDEIINEELTAGHFQLPESKTAEYNLSVEKSNNDIAKMMYNGSAVRSDDTSNPADITLASDNDYSKVKWVLETNSDYPKTSPNAKFNGANSKVVSSVTGDSATIIKTKANGKFNSTVILKLVSEDYKAPTKKKPTGSGTVYAHKEIFITPEKVSAFTDKSLNNITKKDLTFVKDTNDTTGHTYNLTINEGSSFKIPFAAKNGAERALIYDVIEGSGFTVVNGTIKGISGGSSGRISVYPQKCADDFVPYTINVTVNTAIKSIRANTNSISIAPGDTRVISLGTVPPSIGTVYKVSGLSNNYTASISDNLLTITAKSGVTLPKSEKAEITVDGSNIKALTLTVKGISAPQNVKSFKGTKKKKNADGLIEINVPVGSAYNIGVSVDPVSADSSFTWIKGISFDKTNAEITDTSSFDGLDISGDVLIPEKVGVYYVQAVSNGLNASGNHVKSNIYKVNVYSSGSSIVFDDDDYVVQGGFLMSRDQYNSYGNKSFICGDTIVMTEPTTLGNYEPIDWKSNKPAALGVTVINGEMTMNILQTGTFTVTGTSRFTKQKFTFKVMAVSDSDYKGSAFTNSENIFMQTSVDGNLWNNASSENITVGEKLNSRLMVGDIGAAGTIKFSSSDAKIASVNGSGVIKGKSTGKATITATMTMNDKTKLTRSFDVDVTAAQPVIKSITVPEGVLKNNDIKLSAVIKGAKANDCKIQWYYYPVDGSKDNAQALSLTSANGKAKISTSGSYNVFVKVNDVDSEVKQIQVFDVAASKVNTDNGDKALKAHINSLKAKSGTGHGTYFIPIFAFAKDKAQIVSAGDITWTSSNIQLANAKTVTLAQAKSTANGIEEKAVIDACEKAYSVVQIDIVNDNYTGKVTLTGTLKNSGKTVKIALNIADGKRDSIKEPYSYTVQQNTSEAT